jgi:hypothetical protein
VRPSSSQPSAAGRSEGAVQRNLNEQLGSKPTHACASVCTPALRHRSGRWAWQTPWYRQHRYPPLQKTQGRGSHSFGMGNKRLRTLGHRKLNRLGVLQPILRSTFTLRGEAANELSSSVVGPGSRRSHIPDRTNCIRVPHSRVRECTYPVGLASSLDRGCGARDRGLAEPIRPRFFRTRRDWGDHEYDIDVDNGLLGKFGVIPPAMLGVTIALRNGELRFVEAAMFSGKSAGSTADVLIREWFGTGASNSFRLGRQDEPLKAVVEFSSTVPDSERERIFRLNTRCFVRFRGCRSAEDILPGVWQLKAENGQGGEYDQRELYLRSGGE